MLYKSELIKVKSSGGGECDFTGRKIHPMESYLELFGYFSLKRDSIERFEDMISNKENSENVEIKTRHPVSHIRKCYKCSDRFEDNFKIELLTKADDLKRWFCENCSEDIIEKCQELVDYIDEIEYAYKKGFAVICKEEKFKDIIDEKIMSTDCFIKIGSLEKCGYHGKTDLENIDKLVGYLKKAKNNEGPFDDGGYCNYCGKKHEDNKKLKTIFDDDTLGNICRECINPMINEIEEFIEDEKEFIISKTI